MTFNQALQTTVLEDFLQVAAGTVKTTRHTNIFEHGGTDYVVCTWPISGMEQYKVAHHMEHNIYKLPPLETK